MAVYQIGHIVTKLHTAERITCVHQITIFVWTVTTKQYVGSVERSISSCVRYWVDGAVYKGFGL